MERVFFCFCARRQDDVPYDYPKKYEIRLTPYDMFTHINTIYDRFRSCDMICIPDGMQIAAAPEARLTPR